MEKNIQKAIVDVIKSITYPKVYFAAKYISEKFVVRASRRRFNKKLLQKNHNIEAVLVIGKPNFEQRKFIKVCKKAKEPFPIKRVQVKVIK